MHTPVLLKEVLEIFNPRPGQIYIDATINGGGHARAIAERISPAGKLIGIDWDPQLIQESKIKNQELGIHNIILECDTYVHIRDVIQKYHVDTIAGILFDFGFSSHQLENSGRGFSFLKDEPLDMRYNIHENTLTAEKIVNTWESATIADILHRFGEERFARRIAAGISRERHRKPITTTRALVEIIECSIPHRVKNSVHPATRTFQALRIVVNNELDAIARGLNEALTSISPSGIIIAITFHSLEDRIVKNIFQNVSQKGFVIVRTKKPIIPSREEILKNPRSRSAKLRAVQKLDHTR